MVLKDRCKYNIKVAHTLKFCYWTAGLNDLSNLILYNLKYKIAFIILSVLKLNTSCSQEAWQLKKAEDGIEVYTRKDENSSFKELKSVVILKTSLSSIVALLTDFESYPDWVYRCGTSRTVKRINDAEMIHYQEVTAPWPVDSRDFIVDMKVVQNPVTKVITISSTCLPDYIPRIDDHVRITNFKASWTLMPKKDGNVELVYQLLVDPGGNVPAWLVNLAVVEGPFETTMHLRDRVKKDKYQKAILPFIKN